MSDSKTSNLTAEQIKGLQNISAHLYRIEVASIVSPRIDSDSLDYVDKATAQEASIILSQAAVIAARSAMNEMEKCFGIP